MHVAREVGENLAEELIGLPLRRDRRCPCNHSPQRQKRPQSPATRPRVPVSLSVGLVCGLVPLPGL
jgi:hypothetical protein